MPPENEQDRLSQLIAVIQDAIQRDSSLRQTHAIGEKFRFVRERLQSLLETIQKETSNQETKVHIPKALQLEEDEILVYIHLYNAQGAMVRTWQSMITPKAFFDFSVNRPIYTEKKDIEAFIRNKPNKAQHAYITIAMKKERVLPSPVEGGLKDPLGNTVIKVREGSLRHERMVSFTHNELIYVLSEEGNLVKHAPSEATSVK